MLRTMAALVLLTGTPPAHAAWTTTSDAVRAASQRPEIAAVLAAMNRLDTATMTGDSAAFLGSMADDVVVNSPFNNVADKALVAQRTRSGIIDYSAFDRVIDHIALRKSGEVAAMGEEIIRPRGKALHAGKTVHRRFTDVWRNDDGTWKLTLRQATIFKVE